MPIKKTYFEEAQAKAIEFAKERGWFPQAPEDLAKSIMIESAELLEHFQWDATSKNKDNPKNWEEIEMEIADILMYIIGFANNTGINIPEAIIKKLEKQSKKYPIEEFQKGHNEEFYQKQKKKFREGTER